MSQRHLNCLCTLFLLLTITTGTKAQLLGTYSWSYGYGTNDITFLDNNQFRYTYSNCKGIEVGRGTFTIKENILLLQFKDTAIERHPCMTTIMASEHTEGPVTISFIMRGAKDSSALSNLSIRKVESGQLGLTNKSGEASCLLAVEDKPVSFNLGLQENACIVTLKPDKDYKVEAFLFPDRTEPCKESTIRYEISKSGFTLKANYPGAGKRHYVRM